MTSDESNMRWGLKSLNSKFLYCKEAVPYRQYITKESKASSFHHTAQPTKPGPMVCPHVGSLRRRILSKLNENKSNVLHQWDRSCNHVILLKFNNMLDPTHGMSRCQQKSHPKSLHFTSIRDFKKWINLAGFQPNLCADSSNCRYHSVYLWDMRSQPQIDKKIGWLVSPQPPFPPLRR